MFLQDFVFRDRFELRGLGVNNLYYTYNAILKILCYYTI